MEGLRLQWFLQLFFSDEMSGTHSTLSRKKHLLRLVQVYFSWNKSDIILLLYYSIYFFKSTVFACNFHILNNTFAKLISICSLDRAGFSDIRHAHFCCTLRSLKWQICKNYFFELLLGILSDPHETCYVTTTIIDSRYGVLKSLLSSSPNILLVIVSKQLNFCFLWLQSFPPEGLFFCPSDQQDNFLARQPLSPCRYKTCVTMYTDTCLRDALWGFGWILTI